MKKPLRIVPAAGEGSYRVWSAEDVLVGELIRDPKNAGTWFFYASGAGRPVRFQAKDAASAFAFLENLSRAFSAS